MIIVICCMLYGKIENIDDLVIFNAKNIEDFKKEFQTAVNDYLMFCKELNKTITFKPFSIDDYELIKIES